MEAKGEKWKRGCIWALVWGADEDRRWSEGKVRLFPQSRGWGASSQAS